MDSKKVIFITGGATGIGAATVRLFIERGWNVAFMDIDREEATGLTNDIARPESILFVGGNTRSRADIDAAVDATISRWGHLDSVFANAGIHRRNTLLDITDEELDLMIDTNIRGTVNTLRSAVPHIIASGGGSVVINVSDQWYIGKPHSFGYGLTKGALGQITRSLALDLGEQGVRVNAVCAGTVRTPLVDNLFRKYEAEGRGTAARYWEEENALYMRGRVGEPDEIARLVYFLASDESSFCTGGHFLADGGLVAG
ncbi:MAG: SDR family oxidoreductase [Bacteroides sp.]|nr:SDR family oxidoreductase [Bacteroidales bacterium]MBD5254381.1 SDR family oxidoreductase [Barnesiella sp.]MBD5368053.1 SDR family oxidoreductase [Bacteroides sp.]